MGDERRLLYIIVAMEVPQVFERLSRRLGGVRVLALPLVRALATLVAVIWIAVAPASSPHWTAAALTVLGFVVWSATISVALWLRPGPTLRLNLPVVAVDLAFALALIRVTGGVHSVMFLALLLIAALQSYYYGIGRGVGVGLVAAATYLAVVWPTLVGEEWAHSAIQLLMLLGTALGVGVLADLETAERLKVATLTAEGRARERAARQGEKLAALGTLAAGLAHELNNPIGIISSRAELMLLESDAQPLPQALRDDLNVLHRHAQRVARITEGLLSFARQSPGPHAPVDLNLVVEQTLLLIDRTAGAAGIVVTTKLAPALPPVWGDANGLQQVLVNLLANARAVLAEGGEIAVETAAVEHPARGARLVVRDTGPGIAPEVLARIFDPFYTTKPSGTGLGLSISYGIVRDHHGTIDVESAPGTGTTFVLTFPETGTETAA